MNPIAELPPLRRSNVCSWISEMVTLADGRRVASNSAEWRAECEARHILSKNHPKRIELLAVILQRRGESGHAALLATMESVEPAYVLDLPNKAQRNGYLRTVEAVQGENAASYLKNRAMALHEQRAAACEQAAA